MSNLIEAEKTAHDQLKKQVSNRSIKASIQIEPHILEPDLSDNENPDKPYCLLGVRIICGKDKLYDRIWFVHDGKREGTEWEKSKLIWKHLYQYVSDYIGTAMVHGVIQLTDEASYARTLDETELSRIFETSAEVKRYYDAHGSAHKAPVPYDSEFQRWISEYAIDVQLRLQGRDKANIGSVGRLRFSPAEMKQLLAVLESHKSYWRRARNVFWAHQKNPEWRILLKADIVNSEMASYPADDLFDAISEWTDKGEFRYRPAQVALVSAARSASLGNKEDWFSPPTMAQYKMIERAVTEWRKRFEEAKQLNLRW